MVNKGQRDGDTCVLQYINFKTNLVDTFSKVKNSVFAGQLVNVDIVFQFCGFRVQEHLIGFTSNLLITSHGVG